MGTGELIEQSIIDTLKESINATVKLYPENPNSYQPDAYPCEVLVRYNASFYEQADISTSMLLAQRAIEVTVVGQALRGDGAIYDTLSAVTTTLQGRFIECLGTLRIVSERFTDEYQGVWQYVQQYSFNQNVLYGREDTDTPPSWDYE